ncbi:MAG: hypothetical protein IIU83_05825 [Fibrobacteraceae bacterium]|nr:hypothetical protein [Fibrobacteraceae bacterium]
MWRSTGKQIASVTTFHRNDKVLGQVAGKNHEQEPWARTAGKNRGQEPRARTAGKFNHNNYLPMGIKSQVII